MPDLDFNRIPAQSDPNEMQTPICQPLTETSADPAGGDLKHAAHPYVLIPMFWVDTTRIPPTQCRAPAAEDRANCAVPRSAMR